MKREGVLKAQQFDLILIEGCVDFQLNLGTNVFLIHKTFSLVAC